MGIGGNIEPNNRPIEIPNRVENPFKMSSAAKSGSSQRNAEIGSVDED
jgi:hypothetical protein